MADLYGLLLEDLLRGRPPRVPRPFNSDHLLWRAGEHGLHGLLWTVVERGGDRLPGEVVALAPRLKALASGQEAVVRYRLAAAAEVGEAFSRAGVPTVFVKGVALALGAYDRPGDRPFADLDLLVEPAALAAARNVLLELGFRADLTVRRSSMEIRFGRSDLGPGAGVDLHWDFTEPDGSQAAVRVPVGEILGRRREIAGIPVPSPEDSLLLCAANLLRSRMDRLVLLADFDRLVRQGLDWADVRSRAGAWHLRTALWLGFEYAARLFGTRVPPAVSRSVRPPAWRAAGIRRILDGSFLWLRRKFKRRLLTAVLPCLCLDSWSDVARGLAAVGRR